MNVAGQTPIGGQGRAGHGCGFEKVSTG